SALVEIAHRPLGVVAAITPWNGAVGMWCWKVAPAIRAGNTVVLKPSPYAPLASLLLGEIAAHILPPGVVNVVSGGAELGKALDVHRDVRKITFTGSTSAGLSVAMAAAADLKRVTLELGGNDAAIILDDADLDMTVAGLAQFAFINAGQICVAPKRIFVPD